MIFRLLEMIWYSIAFLAAGTWVLSMVIPRGTPPAIGRPLGVALVLGCLAIGYLLAFEKPSDQDCRPAGPAIYNAC